ncbi:MAG TPA: bifunctional 4-hydroxy-2-oxoglutarate aldolase/2-dehydro-3-deoxy-phosphogluconate aldolase [Bryobacteraceae bacterium]|nr:2-dehydro-3-deoxyphosphogluconate aldolase/4-hydroxy-2-oxoglutarate aldolase [Candidatus Sulfopaludibacter sp. SbA4]HYW48938.1 bifunctional 4-hydroxy-2-oxoglutarate aldolase/2-dehydro-3-deoxy-phosphogluconate aldolase [Bryobacteraceae bacterium]
MNREQVRARIQEIGIIPAIRVSSPEDALFAAEAVASGGIPIVELTLTVPGAIEVIAHLVRNGPELIVGAGTVWDVETARRCLDAGAKFLTSTGLDLELVEFAAREKVVVFPGALTPSEVMRAWKAGVDFVKVFPCSQLGGAAYIKTLKAPFPQVPLIASGGVNQQNVADFFLAGATAVGIGAHLVPKKAIELRQPRRIHELAVRLMTLVQGARKQAAAR